MLLTKSLHIFIKVLAVHQLPRSAESVHHPCRMYRSRLGQAATLKLLELETAAAEAHEPAKYGGRRRGRDS